MATANALQKERNEEERRHNKELESQGRYHLTSERIKTFLDPAAKVVGGRKGAISGILNDPSWYKLNPKLASRASRLAFGTPSGLAYDVPDTVGLMANVATATNPNPLASNARMIGTGVARLAYVPTIGGAVTQKSYSENVFIQICRYLMSEIRTAVGPGPKSYDDINVGCVLFVMAEAYGLVAHIARGLAIAKKYSATNRTYGRMLAQAGGYDLDSFQLNINDNIKALNAKISELQGCPIPDQVALIARRVWMNSCVFKDSPTEKAQLYLFRPDCLFAYDDTSTTTPVKAIDFDPYGGSGDSGTWTFQEHIDKLSQIIRSVLDSSDVALMRGDIMTTFNRKLSSYFIKPFYYPLFTDSMLDLKVEYTEEVLEQIHNATICNVGANTVSQEVNYSLHEITIGGVNYLYQGSAGSQDSSLAYLSQDAIIGAIVTKGAGDAVDSSPSCVPLISSRKDNPDEDTVLVDSRLKVSFDFASNTHFANVSSTGDVAFVDKCGSEIVVRLDLYARQQTTNNIGIGSLYSNTIILTATQTIEWYLAEISTWDWFPVMQISGTAAAPVNRSYAFMGDINEFAMFSRQWLSDIHRCVLFSLYGFKVKEE